MVVSISAILFEIIPVLISATLSALIWNFFFIPPRYTFRIDNTEDLLMFLMYFMIALINAVLTNKIKKLNLKKKEEEKKTKTIQLYNTILNSLSHELRTPLATIIASTDTLQEKKESLSENIKNLLYDEIAIASIRLNKQIENLLNMSRLEAGTIKPKLDWVDIPETIYKLIYEFGKETKKPIHYYNENETLLVKTDRGFLETILQNLILNAIEHTPKNSAITIETSLANNELLIIVSDNGLGFPEEEIEFVFDKFYRLKSSSTGGTGIGLSIVKGFVEALDGSINLQNNENGGCNFKIKLPAIINSYQIEEYA
ncbi:ATP-binding protein [Mesonia maritima]|uniref:sensor histidine kinase n=1 Tax=Mesonia maritima TaxID=1793873 RepID=UPI003632FCAB